MSNNNNNNNNKSNFCVKTLKLTDLDLVGEE